MGKYQCGWCKEIFLQEPRKERDEINSYLQKRERTQLRITCPKCKRGYICRETEVTFTADVTLKILSQ